MDVDEAMGNGLAASEEDSAKRRHTILPPGAVAANLRPLNLRVTLNETLMSYSDSHAEVCVHGMAVI